MEFNEPYGVVTQQDSHYTQIFEQDEVLSFILLPDCQIPYHDEKAMACVTKYVADKKPNILVQVGDFLDCKGLGKWVKGSPGQVEGRRLATECLVGRQYFETWRESCPDADMFFLTGNHCDRINKLLDELPYMDGMIRTIEEGLGLDELNITCVKCYPDGEALHIGKLLVTHGNYHGLNAARKHADEFGMSVAHGHNHQISIQTKNHYYPDHVRAGFSLGTLSERRMDFVRGRPTPHQHGFGVGHLFPDGRFWLTLVTILAGEFISPEGKIYSWRD